MARFGPSGVWDPADAPLVGLPDDEEGEAVAPRQELVFIGTGLRGEALSESLRACLLTDAELAGDWADLADPFPDWDVAGAHVHGHGTDAPTAPHA